MKTFHKLASLLATVATSLALGCAPAYHSYSDCYVECGYCSSPPLPYTQYDGCPCHAAVAAPYLAGAVAADSGQLDRKERQLDAVDGHIDELPPAGRE